MNANVLRIANRLARALFVLKFESIEITICIYILSNLTQRLLVEDLVVGFNAGNT